MKRTRGAVQVFGVVPRDLAGRRFIVNGKTAAAVAFGNLALVIHELDGSTPAEIERNRADPRWLVEQARVYQTVLERAMNSGPVVPVRLDTVYEHHAALQEAVDKNAQRWRRSLSRLAGKHEWCLHIYEGPHVADHAEPYVMRVSAGASPYERKEGAVGDHLDGVWKACSALAAASRLIEPPRNERYVFGATFLIRANRARELRTALLRFAGVARTLGLTYYLDGPHPPFTFV